MDRRKFLEVSKNSTIALAALSVFGNSESLSQIRDNAGWQDLPGFNGKVKVKLLWVPDEMTSQPTSPFAEARAMAFQIAPGVQFPRHKHQAHELTYVIEGSFVQPEPENGYWSSHQTNQSLRKPNNRIVQKTYKKGDVLFMPEGSIHEVTQSQGAVILAFNSRKNLYTW